jgi:hypothetical protein
MPAGWLYVLVNSSMPGLVKVGKTVRDPDQRANELSGVTGVATPFVVAFDLHFADCDSAEKFVHIQLTRRGLRENESREFFRIRVSEVVNILLFAAEQEKVTRSQSVIPDHINNADVAWDEETDELTRETSKPWEDLYFEAGKHYIGDGDYIQNSRTALMLFKDALRLGSLKAYNNIGHILSYGDGVPKDTNEALQYLQEGAKKGNYWCFTTMARLYAGLNEYENESKCWRLFFEAQSGSKDAELRDDDEFAFNAVVYLFSQIAHNKPVDMHEYIIPLGNRLVMAAQRFKEENPGPAGIAIFRDVSRWVNDNCAN